jgi:cytochrome d ubiquinol oxidase subunit II
VALSLTGLAATLWVNPRLLDHYRAQPAGWLIPVLVAAGLAGILYFTRAGRELPAFLSSCVYLGATLGGAAFGLYPALLPSSGDPANSVTIRNASAAASSLSIGLIWWGIGMLIAVGYFVVVYTMFRGKIHGQAR